ncbi:hypothetical protein L7F22_036143 [Adiantum nelumboides]|nr:hypothetical protein [Adiantum nelumboides]
MASFSALRSQVFDREERKRQYADNLMGLNAHDRHKKFMNDYVLHYSKPSALVEQRRPIKTDQDTLRETYRFIRTDDDDLNSSWEQRLAKRYYDKLFKEYCIADMARYKDGKIGMRWRAEKEVIAGKGQFVCGSRKCEAKDDLSSYEVNFTYREAGENKQALVKLRVCPGCGEKLNYKRDRDREMLKQIPDRDKKRLKSEERLRKNEKRGKKRCIADVQQSSESKADMCDQIYLAGGSSLSPPATGDGVTQITSQEEEYDKYFKGMFP